MHKLKEALQNNVKWGRFEDIIFMNAMQGWKLRNRGEVDLADGKKT